MLLLFEAPVGVVPFLEGTLLVLVIARVVLPYSRLTAFVFLSLDDAEVPASIISDIESSPALL